MHTTGTMDRRRWHAPFKLYALFSIQIQMQMLYYSNECLSPFLLTTNSIHMQSVIVVVGISWSDQHIIMASIWTLCNKAKLTIVIPRRVTIKASFSYCKRSFLWRISGPIQRQVNKTAPSGDGGAGGAVRHAPNEARSEYTSHDPEKEFHPAGRLHRARGRSRPPMVPARRGDTGASANPQPIVENHSQDARKLRN